MRLCVIYYIYCRHLSTGLNEAKLNHLCKLRLEETSIKCVCVDWPLPNQVKVARHINILLQLK